MSVRIRSAVAVLAVVVLAAGPGSADPGRAQATSCRNLVQGVPGPRCEHVLGGEGARFDLWTWVATSTVALGDGGAWIVITEPRSVHAGAGVARFEVVLSGAGASSWDPASLGLNEARAELHAEVVIPGCETCSQTQVDVVAHSNDGPTEADGLRVIDVPFTVPSGTGEVLLVLTVSALGVIGQPLPGPSMPLSLPGSGYAIASVAGHLAAASVEQA